jgi:hypothetical protein
VSSPKKTAPRKKTAPKKFALPPAQRPPRDVPRDLFLVFRAPRVGMANPQRLTNASWVWLARNRELNAWAANRHFEGPSSMAVGPGWCFNRFGRTDTELPDGRVVSIAGEHEDHYDPDFYIYNDVAVTDPSGDVAIYGYPHEVFPPTDFHSATRVGERIVVIGCLGYPSMRVPGATPVFALDTRTLAFSRLDAKGDAPGWIFEHTAALSDDEGSITVRGGKRWVRAGDVEEIRENIDDWSLDLASLAWTRLTERRWASWELARADGGPNHLFTIEMLSWTVRRGSPFGAKQVAEMEAEVGGRPDFEVYAARYAPPVEHTKVEREEDGAHNVTRIVVEGVTVRYVEGGRGVRVTVEGALAQEKVDAVVEDARRKLEALERTAYTARRLVG